MECLQGVGGPNRRKYAVVRDRGFASFKSECAQSHLVKAADPSGHTVELSG